MSRSVLGIRTSGSEKGSGYVRYVILEGNSSDFKVRDMEHTKLTFPTKLESISEKLAWFYRELEELYEANKDISIIVLKSNDYNSRSRETAARLSAYYDSVVLLFANHKNIPISQLNYNNLKTNSQTNSKNVQEKAKNLIGIIPNPASEIAIADAVLAAHWGLKYFD
ncbi:MAG: hypothetical protein ACK551_01730 [Vampirovibrionales bacterium]